jgi:hypothetical protein
MSAAGATSCSARGCVLRVVLLLLLHAVLLLLLLFAAGATEPLI